MWDAPRWWVAFRFGCGFFLGLVSGGGERWRAFFWDLLFVMDGDSGEGSDPFTGMGLTNG